jgi:CRISPR system Cascade subunit CasD
MADYLVLRLYGPLASWGEIAVGESRHSAVHPSKSALLGLLGAALGVVREDDAGQQALFEGYRFGVKLVCPGTPLRDYHTVQAPPRQSKVLWRSRRQELADKARLGTLLSAREYRCDSLAVIAVEALPNARWSLEDLAAALRRPWFPLYLGRKSCPLALPLAPQQVADATLYTALEQTPQNSLLALLATKPKQPWPNWEDKKVLRSETPRYYWEDGMEPGMQADMQVVRNDQPLSRRRWQFGPRREWVALSAEDKG